MRQKIVSETLTWLNTPYHHASRIKGAGVDCAQILISVYSAVGMVEEFDTDYYPMDWALHRGDERYLSYLLKYAKPTDNPQAGDIAVFKFGRCISHAGIMINENEMVHAWLRAKKVVISRIDEGELNGRLAGFFTLFGEK